MASFGLQTDDGYLKSADGLGVREDCPPEGCGCDGGEFWRLSPCACDDGAANLWADNYDPSLGCVWAKVDGACYTVCPDSEHKAELDAGDTAVSPGFTQASSHEDGCSQCCEPPIFDRCCDFQSKSKCSVSDGWVRVTHRVYVFGEGSMFDDRDPPPDCNISYAVNDDRTFDTDESFSFCYQDSGPNLYTLGNVLNCDGEPRPGLTIRSTVTHFPWSGTVDTSYRCNPDDPFRVCKEATIPGPNFIEFIFEANSIHVPYGMAGTVTIGDGVWGADFSLLGFDHPDGELWSTLEDRASVTINRQMRGECMHGASFTFDAAAHVLLRYQDGSRHFENQARVIVIVEYTAHAVGACPPGGGRPGRRRFVSAEDFLQ